MGRLLLGVAIVGAVCGVAFEPLDRVGAISSDTAVNLGLLSVGLAAGVIVIGFVLRARLRLAREAMFVGLATIGAWFLVIVYALGRDTP
jgi:hypothetical protein